MSIEFGFAVACWAIAMVFIIANVKMGSHPRAQLFGWIALSFCSVAVFFAIASIAKGHTLLHCKKGRCKRHVVQHFEWKLKPLRHCETRGLGKARWTYNGSSGFDGAYQFSPQTWSATGSRYGYAWAAPPREQSYRAVVWASKIGWQWSSTAGWPVCGR